MFTFLLYCINTQYKRPYPKDEIKTSNVYATMEKLKGMNENELKAYTLNKFEKQNIKPFFNNGKYIQSFKAMTPAFSELPSLYYVGPKGKVDLTYEKNFIAVLGSYGKSGIGEGKVIYLDGNDIGESNNDIKGNILLTKDPLLTEYIKFAQDSGAKAIVALDSGSSLYDNRDLNLKNYDGLPIFYVNNDIFEKIKGASAVGFKLDFKYEESNSFNVAGYIQGAKNKNVIYAANSLSSLAYMYELMDSIKASQVKPYYNLVFVFLDKAAGETPSILTFLNSITNKEADKFIMLGPIGIANTREVQLSIDNQKGFEVAPLITSNNNDQYLTIGISNKNIPKSFEILKNSGLEAIYFRDGYSQSMGLTNYNSEDSAIKLTNKEVLNQDVNILSNVNKKVIYKIEFSDISLKVALIILLITFIPYYLLKLIEKRGNEKVKYFGNITAAIYKYINLSVVIFIFVALIGFIPKDILIKNIGGKLYSNYSFPYIFNNVLLYIDFIFHHGFGTFNNAKIINIIKDPILKSSKLIILSIFISLILGVYIGIKNGIKGKDSSGSLASIILLSIPDALILVCILILIGLFEKYKILQSVFGNMTIKTFVMPLICITIIPTVYIWRISYTACVEEVKKDYIRNAKGRGKKGFMLGLNELLPPILLNVLKSMSSVIMITLSNLLLVEYVYYYPGVAFNLLSAYQHGQISLFIPLSLSLCLIYIILTSFFRIWAVSIDPFKR